MKPPHSFYRARAPILERIRGPESRHDASSKRPRVSKWPPRTRALARLSTPQGTAAQSGGSRAADRGSRGGGNIDDNEPWALPTRRPYLADSFVARDPRARYLGLLAHARSHHRAG